MGDSRDCIMHPRVADYPRRLDVERVTYGFPGIFEEAGIYGGCRPEGSAHPFSPNTVFPFFDNE